MRDFFQSWGLLLVALAIGLLTFFLTNGYLANKERSIRDRLLSGVGEKVTVVVATQNVPAGKPVGSNNMAVAEIEVKHLSKSAITPDQFDRHAGQVLKYPIYAGEPLLTHMLDGLLIDRFSDLIEIGERAVTIEVDTIASNAGLLVVGDYVDVVVSGEFPRPGDTSKQKAYLPLFQKVKVLAIDRNPLLSEEQDFRTDGVLAGPDQSYDFSTVSLALDDDDANLLAFASGIGEIKFLLRNPKDPSKEEPDFISAGSLLKNQATTNARGYLYMSNSGAGQSAVPVMTVADAVSNENLRGLGLKSIPRDQASQRANPYNTVKVDALSVPNNVNKDSEKQANDTAPVVDVEQKNDDQGSREKKQ